MAYCTKADLDRAFHPRNIVRWADDDNDGALSAAELATITALIAEADGMVDAALCGRYSVPFGTVPAMILRCSLRIAGFLLAKRRGFTTVGGDNDAMTIVGDYDDAKKWLAEVALGKASIPGFSELSSGIQSSTEDVEPIYSRTAVTRTDGTAIDEQLDGTLDGF